MKKLFLFLFIVFINYSCTNNEKKIEVVNLDFSTYKTYGDITSKEDKPAVPMNDIEGIKSIRSILLDKIKGNPQYSELKNASLDKKPGLNNNYHYLILINETGTVDKIIINKSMGKELDNIVIDEVSGWKFTPAVINGEKVKFQYDLQFDGTDYFVAVEKMPEPIGGLQGISKLVHYPEIAKRAGIQGRVYVKAYINEMGDVDSAEILKGIGAGCDESALEAVKQAKFTPAMDNGVNVKVQVTVPILFKLQ